jgi:uncharacterized protein YabE (DUF348 family)
MVWRFVLTFILLTIFVVTLGNSVFAQDESGHLIKLYDRGVTRVFISDAKTIGEALKEQDIELDSQDTVEPSLNEQLVARSYYVNIYRARPVLVVDGAIRIKALSPYQTAKKIAESVGINVYDGDIVELSSMNVGTDGAGLELTIKRATPIILDLYGKKTEIRTQRKTVGDMLKEKNIILGTSGRVSVPEGTAISSGMEIRVWREGKQTASVDQKIQFASQIVYDADRPIGYRVVQHKGALGTRSITYQLEIKDGVEISRVEIANIITRSAKPQTVIIGIHNDGSGLTHSKGAQFFTDSKGVSHRETYYDLNMRVVMRSCGQGGQYSVRPDGAKVDAEGYIIIAASYSNYPKCSIVETSLGPGKVYDTGGFVSRYPYGFDLATDWSRTDGI